MNNAKDKRKERILEVSIEHFTRWGYNKTSMEEVARGARIAKATIYYYFPSKEQLFIAAIRTKAEELFIKLEKEINSANNFEDKFSSFLRLPMIYIFENMPILIEAMHQNPFDGFESLDQIRTEYRDRMGMLLSGIIVSGKKEGLVNDWVNPQQFSLMFHEWFMLGDNWIDLEDKDKIIRRIERDHDLIVRLILFGIIKPARKESLINEIKKEE
ncbi:MAG: TetR/AcrR family transcriptional regulator [Candidatus Cloacimonetes bacterium]|nr:TetR/AcrR family transcriptional regulator [Candidatus Cloacimonadota bacterium]